MSHVQIESPFWKEKTRVFSVFKLHFSWHRDSFIIFWAYCTCEGAFFDVCDAFYLSKFCLKGCSNSFSRNSHLSVLVPLEVTFKSWSHFEQILGTERWFPSSFLLLRKTFGGFEAKFMQVRSCLFRKILDFALHATRISLVRILLEFYRWKFPCRPVLFKPSKKEGENGEIKEVILRVLRVLIHGLSNDWEVNQWVSQICIVFVVSVAEHEQFEKFDKFESFRSWQLFDQLGEFLFGKG